jgi:ankyrin repeat protein
MQRINSQVKDQAELAMQVLSRVTCVKRPLTIIELQHALAVEVNESKLDEENISQIEDIISVCAGLVTVDEESSIIRLVHYTTQEYFDRTQREWFPSIETNIATICVTYLLFDEFESGICQNDEELKERLQSNRLYDYASRNWGHHAREAAMLIPEVISFLETKAHVDASSQALMAVERWLGGEGIQEIPKQITGLHLAAHFGVDRAVRFLISCNNRELKDSYSQTPLSYAATNGHNTIVQLLLEKGAEIESKDKYGQTPLSRGATNGHEGTVRLLLENGAKIEAKDKFGWTPLSQAATNGHNTIIGLLVEKGADVESKDNLGRAPLSQTAKNGHEETAWLLLKEGANIESKDKFGRTPLSRAAANGRRGVAQLLLEKYAEIESTDKYGRTPLSQATRNGHEGVVQLLLEKGADIKTIDKYGQKPLWRAIGNGHEGIVQLLYKHVD